ARLTYARWLESEIPRLEQDFQACAGIEDKVFMAHQLLAHIPLARLVDEDHANRLTGLLQKIHDSVRGNEAAEAELRLTWHWMRQFTKKWDVGKKPRLGRGKRDSDA